ncbi:hypothetical protein K501DRAFT_273921 [Backusella circina FSU 941]|nr:hypothetical protein K501DRAFT_273921 [Backusella circina FSU 941]
MYVIKFKCIGRRKKGVRNLNPTSSDFASMCSRGLRKTTEKKCLFDEIVEVVWCQLLKRVPQAVQTPFVSGSMTSNSILVTSVIEAVPTVGITSAVNSAGAVPVASGSNIGEGVNVSMVSTVISGNSATATAGSSNNTANNLAGLPTSASYGNTVFPGTAMFLAPTPSKSVIPLYRINAKENVTFVWSFTNLLVRPANLTLAAVAPNKVTYTITQMNGMKTSAIWHISDVPAATPLMMGAYQIQLCDQRGPSAIPQPGWLTPVTRLSIAFYSAESYQPSSGSGYCPTCFYSASLKPVESFKAFTIAFCIACSTSIMLMYKFMS